MTTVPRPNQDVIRPDKDSALLAEENPFEAMMSRFDYAAKRLSLDPGLYKVLRAPEKQIIVSVPIVRDNGEVDVYHGLSGAVQHLARSGQGRHPLRHRRHARRSEGAGRVDDLEVRGGQHSVRRRQGRRGLRPVHAVQRRAGADHPPLHLRHHRYAGARFRRAGARRQHQRAGDGVDHGHLLHAQAPHGHRRRHRQAGRDGRLARPARGDGAGLHARDPGGAQAAAHADRGDPGRDSGLRQRRLGRRAAHGEVSA